MTTKTPLLRAAAIAALLLLAAPLAALAQSSPNLTTGQIPTAGQWNSYFAAKQDVIPYQTVNKAGDTMLGRLVTFPPSTSTTGFRLPPGAAPLSPTNGDLWTTTSGLFVRVNGVTIGPLTGSTTSSFAATAPLTVSFPAGVTTYALTVDSNFAVTGSALAFSSISAGNLLANCTASSAAPTTSTFTACLNQNIGTAQGTIVQRGASAWQALAPGTAGLPLLSGGAAANVAYGIPALAAGGTGAALTASNGGLVWSNGTTLSILAGTATANQIPLSGASATPAWSTSTYPATSVAGSILASLTANAITATRTPTLGLNGTAAGTLTFQGLTSGSVVVTPQATAGAPTLTLPNSSGTFAIAASSPISLSAATGMLTCPTCVTSSGGGAVTGSAPVAVSAAGVVSITGSAGGVLAGASPAFTNAPTLGVAGSSVGSVAFANATSGSITLQPQTGALGSGVLTMPAATDTLAVLALAQTFTNKTLTAPTINGGTHTAITSFGLRSTGAAFDLTMATSEVLTAGRTISWNVGDAARSITLGGNVTTGGAFSTTGTFSSGGTFSSSSTVSITGAFSVAGAFSTAAAVTHAGAFATTITATNTTNSTLPAGTHTLATIDAAQTFASTQTFTLAPVFTDQSGSRTALGLGTAATQNTGTSGANVPLLNGANTWGAVQTLPSPALTGTVTGNNTIPLTILAQGAANTMLGNWTSGTANVSANVMPSCADSGGSHLNYVSGTGVTCGTTTGAAAAGTLTGTTLNATVVTSSLTSVGTLTNGSLGAGFSTVAIARGGSGQTTAAAARASSGFNIDQITSTGDADATLAATTRVAGTTAALTAARTWTLPAASAVNPGQSLLVADFAGGVTPSNTLTVLRAGADTVNGGTSVAISVANGAYMLVSDGTSKWTAQSMGAASGGGVTSITAGRGLSGGVISTSGTIALRGFAVSNVVTVNASGTYTVPANVNALFVEAVGGGGGGGYVDGVGASEGAGGGGAGGSCAWTFIQPTLSATYTVTIGTSGAGGVAPATPATAGGDTTFGTTPIGKGGGAGTEDLAQIPPHAGGVGGTGTAGSTGDDSKRGSPGGSGVTVSASEGVAGFGGAAGCGSGGAPPGRTTSGPGVAAAANGGGGGGGALANSATDRNGGAGGTGYVRIWELM